MILILSILISGIASINTKATQKSSKNILNKEEKPILLESESDVIDSSQDDTDNSDSVIIDPSDSDNSENSDSGNLENSDSGNLDNSDSGNLDNSDSGNLENSDSGNLENSDSGNLENSDSGNLENSDSGNLDNSDSGNSDNTGNIDSDTDSANNASESDKSDLDDTNSIIINPGTDNSEAGSNDVDDANSASDLETGTNNVDNSNSTIPLATSTPTPTPLATPSKSPSKSPTPDRTLEPTLEPTPDPIPEPPVVIVDSNSKEFTFSSEGFTGDKEAGTKVDKESENLTKVVFTEQEITIKQTEKFESNTPVYFAASKPNSTVIISEDVSESNIGLTTENEPTLQVAKESNPVSLMNTLDSGVIEIKFSDNIGSDGTSSSEPQPEITQITLNAVENRRGDFNIVVPESVKSVVFSIIRMARQSSFGVRSNQNSDSAILLADEETNDVDVQVQDRIEISPVSQVTLNSVKVGKELSTYDNSTVNFKKSSSFSEESSVTISLLRPKSFSAKTQPLILFDEEINTLPNTVTITSNNPIEVSNFPIIGSKSSFPGCNDLKSKITFPEGKQPKTINGECRNVNGVNTFYLNTSEQDDGKDDKKLSSGAIAGIVIACLAVVGVIVAVIVVVVYRKRHDVHSKGLVDLDDLT